jgi:steroid 5-alpha reductase family enzyme
MDPFVLVGLAAALSVSMALAWAVQRKTGSSGWVDTIWSVSLGLVGVAAAVLAEGSAGRGIAAAVVIAIWAVRLGSHIGLRTTSGEEDPRYAKFLEDWGPSAAVRLFWFLQIQAVAAFILVLAVYLAASNDAAFPRAIDLLALALAAVALGGEAIADRQLAEFRRTPRAKTDVCETGLWAHSRHPNYFFEWLGWCVWPLLAITASPWSWLSLLAPVLMYWLLVHVSGIPPLEEHMLRSRGDAFRALQSRVNAFFPGPRKQGSRNEGTTS